TTILEKLDVPYLVGGSLASSLHGEPRATQDVDIVADLKLEHVEPFVSALRDRFYVDDLAVRDAVKRRSTFNVIHLETMFKVDVFVAGNQRSTRRELERRQLYTLDVQPPEAISVASPEDIIVQKLHWYRLGDHVSDRQWRDAMSVLKIRNRKLDLDYMRELASEMGVDDLLVRALREAGLGS
ncbi:MAG TPA: hypothetical protein VFS20_11420, partial [Longimicrobium sp.]|nr:hypothetical protein [Longimicrobium sp.]